MNKPDVLLQRKNWNDILSNETLTVKEKEAVDLLVYRQTDIGYEVIINNKHKGMLHAQ